MPSTPARFLLLAALLWATGCGESADPPPTDTTTPDESGAEAVSTSDYPLTVPAGWIQQSVPGYADDFLLGPTNAGFTVNVNLVREPFAGDLDTYGAATLQMMPQVVERFAVVSRSEMTTDAGLRMLRIVTTSYITMKDLRQVVYLTKSGATCYVITGSALAADGDAHDAEFDAIARSFVAPS